MTVAVIHLVREANGAAALQSFLDAYKRNTDQPLTLACKGFRDGDVAPAGSFIERTIMLPDVGFDIGSYRRAALEVDTDHVCFLNSFSRPWVNGWLDMLLYAIQMPETGIAGATGSWEGVEGAPFPNPHIRSNAFVMRRDVFLSLDLPEPQTKMDACLLEAGPRSITRQIRARGLRALICNADDEIWSLDYDPPWGADEHPRESCTFRWGGQEKLLVADNRTDAYTQAPPDERAHLERMAWGEAEA